MWNEFKKTKKTDSGTHIGFPFVFDQQEDVVQLIQLFLRVPRCAADRDHHYVL